MDRAMERQRPVIFLAFSKERSGTTLKVNHGKSKRSRTSDPTSCKTMTCLFAVGDFQIAIFLRFLRSGIWILSRRAISSTSHWHKISLLFDMDKDS
jgi:hypothetical protein